MEITSCPCPWLSSGGRDIGFGQHDVFDSYQLKNVWQDATSSSDIRINIQNICHDPYEKAFVVGRSEEQGQVGRRSRIG